MGRLRGIHEGERQKTGNFLGVLISQLRVQLPAPLSPLSRMKYFREIAFTRSLHLDVYIPLNEIFKWGNDPKIHHWFVSEKGKNYEISKSAKLNTVAEIQKSIPRFRRNFDYSNNNYK